MIRKLLGLRENTDFEIESAEQILSKIKDDENIPNTRKFVKMQYYSSLYNKYQTMFVC